VAAKVLAPFLVAPSEASFLAAADCHDESQKNKYVANELNLFLVA
jgi:hypothetical protein